MSEKYSGVRFDAVKGEGEGPRPRGGPADKELVELGKYYGDEGLAPYEGGNWGGNMSYMSDGCMTITRSGCPLGNISREDLVEVTHFDYDAFSAIYYTRRGADPGTKPSSETGMHWKLYRSWKGFSDTETPVILHGHAEVFRGIEDSLDFPTTEREVPYGTKAQADLVAQLLDSDRILLIRNHGFVILAGSFEETWKLSEKVVRIKNKIEGNSE